MEIKIIPKRYFLYYGILRNIRNIDLNFAIPNSHHMINKEEDAKDRFAFSWKQGGSYNRITRISILGVERHDNFQILCAIKDYFPKDYQTMI